MKCSKCLGTNIRWSGKLFKGEEGWIASVSASCPNCKRTYQAGIDWKKFKLQQIGGSVDGKPPKEPEELIPAGDAQKLIDNLAKQMKMPGMEDPRGR